MKSPFRARRVAQGVLAVLILAAGAARAQALPDLPPAEQALAAIGAHPAVAAARAGVGVEAAGRRRLAAGPYEPSVRLQTQSRHDSTSGRTYGEWDVTLERSFRWFGKSELDHKIGEQGVAQARLAVGDARHEAGRALLRQWFAWVRAASLTATWREQREVLARQAQVVARREALGDAALQERVLAEAALAQAEAGLTQAQAREDVAASELRRGFPELRLGAAPPALAPREPGRDAAWWEARILEHNHELAFARSEVERRRTLAERARADRTSDPSLGVRVASERAGNERVAGLVLAIPIGGEVRAAAQEAALAQVDVATQRAAQVERKLGAEAAAAWSSALRSYEGWQKSATAAAALSRSAELSARAYALGEGTLAEVLQARRLAIEARQAEVAIGFDAVEARYRLLLDAHELWDFDEP